jgi:hypothetical protein
MPFSKGSMITEPDGSLLIKDVPMLAEGVWTDSTVGTPLNYISRTLEADAANWIDNSGWNRHIGKVPRASTDKVGEAVNPHFGRFTGGDGREHAAVLSDVRVWPWTQNQRDMQEMIRHNLISFVSVEHTGPEQYNAETHQMESAGLTFTGFAFVNKGACKLCQIPRANEVPSVAEQNKVPMLKKEESLEGLQTRLQKALDDKFTLSSLPGGKYAASTWIVMTFPDRVIYSQDGKKFEIPFMMDNGAIALGTPVEVEEVYVEKKALEMFPGADPKELMAAIQKKQVKQDKTMEPKELEAAITAAVTAATAPIMRELEAVKASQKPTEAPKIEIPKELAELPATIKTLSALPETIKALADRVEALEKDGTPKTKVEIRELEDPVNAGILIGVDNGTPVIRRA